MAFADPQTLTIDATPYTCNLISSESSKSVYATADGTLRLTISHQGAKDRTRRMVRVDQQIVAADPLSSENEYKNLGIYVVIDEPNFGFDSTAVDNVVQALVAWLDTAAVTKVLGSQH